MLLSIDDKCLKLPFLCSYFFFLPNSDANDLIQLNLVKMEVLVLQELKLKAKYIQTIKTIKQ